MSETREGPVTAGDGAAAAAQPAPDSLRTELEALARIWREESEPYAGEDPEAVARRGGFAYCADELAAVLAQHPEPAAPAAASELAFPAAQAALARVLSWFAATGTRREASATRAQLAHAYADGGLTVPDELRKFL